MPIDSKTHEALGLHKPASKSIGATTPKGKSWTEPYGDRQYHPCAEAYPKQGSPKGEVFHIKDWSSSNIYPNSSRDIYIYTPPRTNRITESPSLAFFNDGAMYVDPNGSVRAARLWTISYSQKIYPTVGVFVNPGKERSLEYDSMTPTFVNFINEEILPLVESHLGYEVHKDPERRLICGMSSGGICAFNAAWHSPNSFGCVLSHCGSFTNIRGGHNYPYLVRSSEEKPIKVLLQSGNHDLNILWGTGLLPIKLWHPRSVLRLRL